MGKEMSAVAEATARSRIFVGREVMPIQCIHVSTHFVDSFEIIPQNISATCFFAMVLFDNFSIRFTVLSAVFQMIMIDSSYLNG